MDTAVEQTLTYPGSSKSWNYPPAPSIGMAKRPVYCHSNFEINVVSANCGMERLGRMVSMSPSPPTVEQQLPNRPENGKDEKCSQGNERYHVNDRITTRSLLSNVKRKQIRTIARIA
jgi:hypothetical protein